MTIYETYKGKKVDVDYETGYHFIIEYLSENELEWTALGKLAKGAPSKEKEPYVSYDLGDGKFMVNWIEESGLVLSQIADFANGKVYAFMTWPDDAARGHRGQLLHKGTLRVLD
ncbi:MAG: MoaF N-terminal domain-containing protein [Lactimicrobium sp.]|uniref:MoaF-related domain-containing protein n=1 Tax=Lactimicrobium sp. TaxID=2563780 RepID=UPI002F357D2F